MAFTSYKTLRLRRRPAKNFSKFFGTCKLCGAIDFHGGNFVCESQMARAYARGRNQVLCIYVIDVGGVDVNVIRQDAYRERGDTYLARGYNTGRRGLDAASNKDTTPARASGPSSCAARGKWISCSMSTG